MSFSFLFLFLSEKSRIFALSNDEILMNNPPIKDYIEAIKSAEENYVELSCLRTIQL